MRFHDLSKRIISALISIAVLAAILVFSHVGVVKWVIALFTAAVGALAIWEYCRLAKLGAARGMKVLCMAIGAIVILAFFLTTFRISFALFPYLCIFVGAVAFFLYHFNKISGATDAIAKGLFTTLYIAVPLGLSLKILYLFSPYQFGQEGRIWFLYLLIVTKMTDVGAYFGGRLLGRRKLAIELSPGKTVAGAVFGFLSALLFSFLFYFFSDLLPQFSLSLGASLCLGALLGFLGQVGDLAESLLKRDADVKDSNRLPGLGGILDMLDSLLFTAPVVYFFLYLPKW